jgi:F-type H+-transporting ATPase subunit epsilon
MAEATQLELVTPARVMRSKSVEMVVIPGSEGLFGVLANHAPVLANLQRGVVEVHEGGKIVDRIMIDGGVTDVTAHGVTILAERAENLDTASSQEVRERALSSTGVDAEFLNIVAEAI